MLMDAANDSTQARIMSWQTCVCNIKSGSVEKLGPRIVTYLSGIETNGIAGEKGVFHKVISVEKFDGESERVYYSDRPLKLYLVSEDIIYLKMCDGCE